VRNPNELSETLAQIKRPGSFAAQRKVTARDLRLEVSGVGPIRFPISKAKARELCAVARPARHGLKDQTLLDRRVRDTWEISKSRLKIDQRTWKKTLVPELDRVRDALGLAPGCELKAELHNLLVYAPGQFFVPHQDSEKADDMIGTLVVTLPSAFTGGAIIVQHHDAKVAFRGSSKDLTFIAFYADCHHQVRPVSDGYRIVLTYNLLLSSDGASALPQVASRELDSLERRVHDFFQTPPPPRWSGASPEEPPDRLVYLLDHQYSQKGLGWNRLKNGDAPRTAALREVARRLDCEIFLALADVHETWSCDDESDSYAGYDEYSGYGRRSARRRYRRYQREDIDDDEDTGDVAGEQDDTPELIELQDSSVELRHFVDVDGTAEAVSGHVDLAELCYTKPSDELDPFTSKHEGYMGNWGNTVDRWYHRAAVVLWPRERTFVIRAKTSARWAIGEVARALKGEGIEVARNMAAQLTPFWSGVASVDGPRNLFKKTLSVSLALGAPEIAAALVRPFRLEQLTPSVVAELVGVIERYGVEWARDAFAEWSSHGSEGFAEARIAWLGSVQVFIRAVAATGSVAARQFARRLVSEQWTWLTERYLAAASDLPSRVLKALARLDQPLLGLIESNVALGGSEPRASMRRFLTSEERPVLALVSLLESVHRTYRGTELSALGLGVVHAHCVAELTRRLSRPVRAPDDWSIAPPKQCSCALCLELGRFLVDRSRIRFDWPLATDKRAHVHRAVTAHELPVTHVTQRSGRPYTLVLVKTKALFERETAERIAWQRGLDWLTHRERAFQERVAPRPRRAAIVPRAGRP
jgi:hypothetical protein